VTNAAKLKTLRMVLKFKLGSLFALVRPNDEDYRGRGAKRAELARLIRNGLRDGALERNSMRRQS
jgi:hypothetical protein